LTSKQEVAATDEVSGSFVNEEEGFDKKTTFEVEKLKGKVNTSAFVGAKVDDVVTVSTKDLFKEAGDYRTFLGMSEEETTEKNLEVSFKIEEINHREAADLDQELFDKLYGPGVINSVTELKDKIKEEGEGQFKQQSDQQLLNDVTEALIENTKFDLPAEFLKKWIQRSGEKELTAEQAEEEYARSEKAKLFQKTNCKLPSKRSKRMLKK
ncbi:MAG: trigger factor, partial [Leeuwenhoekiella sp.]|nr:trigger factor [Leeuwenhoekiella sp.]